MNAAWRSIDELPPFDERPMRLFIRIEGSKYHSGERWARLYCGDAYIRPADAPDGVKEFRASDILRMCEDGDMDVHSIEVTHWMPAAFPPIDKAND